MCVIDSLIFIRGNINEGIESHLERIKADEEREKAEREAKWEREREQREREKAAFEAEHPNMCAHTYYSYYNHVNFSFYYGGYCTIRFYEWSNIDGNCITYHYRPELYKFLDDCGLLLSNDQAEIIKNNTDSYVICKPNSKELLVASSREALVDLFKACCV